MGAGNRKNRSGFTLVELLVTIAVVAIFSVVAIPNFQGLLERNKVASDYNLVLSAVNYARSEAVKRRTAVTLSLSGTSQVRVLNVSYNEKGDDVLLRAFNPIISGVEISNSTIEFNALGRLSACNTDDVSNCKISVGDKFIVVNPAGSVNPDA